MKEIPVFIGPGIDATPKGKIIIPEDVLDTLAHHFNVGGKLMLSAALRRITNSIENSVEVMSFRILVDPSSRSECVWVVREHSDKTEGRGPMKDVGVFNTEEEAFERCYNTSGVMGNPRHYGGEIWRVSLGNYPFDQELVFGYRKDWNDNWGQGWINLRDKPKDDDPDYIEYTRLRKKFDPTYEE